MSRSPQLVIYCFRPTFSKFLCPKEPPFQRVLLPAFWVLCCCLLMVPAPCRAQTIEERYAAVRDTYRNTFGIQDVQRRTDTLRQCIRQLGEVMQSDDQMKVSDRCLYLIGQCHHHLFDLGKDPRDLQGALDHYRKLVEQHAGSPLADDAQYLTGVILMTQNPQQAFIEFRKVALFFPKGDSKTKANQMMDQLRRESGCKDLKEQDLPHQVVVSKQDGTAPSATPPRPPEPNWLPLPPSGSEAKVQQQVPLPCPSVGELQRIQTWSGESYSRVALYTSTPVSFDEQASGSGPPDKPSQISVLLRGCVVNPKLDPHVKTSDPFLEKVSVRQKENNMTQVVLDARSLERYRIFTLSDPHRVIIDVQGAKPQPAASLPAGRRPPVESAKLPSLARQLGLEVSKIVLDPGHGGKDKGATGPNGVFEKDITLAVALELKKKLESELSCQVIMTRTGDRYIPLEARAALANAQKADLFISIHTNAHGDSKYFGTETYFLDFSKDQESARVAAFENSTSTKKISDLERILKDLLMNTKIKESSQLAKQVQNHIVKQLRGGQYDDVRDLGVKQAPFWVLLGAEMPCILVETAFITHPREEARLKDKDFRRCMAQGIASGIGAYIQQIKGLTRLGDRS
jgi:N-acetylmuramoyl-L-alanine amidase